MKELRVSLLFLLLMTGLFGGVYPAFVWFFGQVLFSHTANGSLLVGKGKIIGSELIGQNFTEKKYFWPRPSVTLGKPYNTMPEGLAPLSPADPALRTRIEDILKLYADKKHGPLPMDMVTASASGLDPHISYESAMIQAPRVAKARHLPLEQVQLTVKAQLIRPWIESGSQGLINVVILNALLDTSYGGGP